jgi:hypothetical protein
MYGSGILSAMAATGWMVAAAISLSDGVGGIEVPRWLSTAGVMVIVCGTIISGGAWLVEDAQSRAVERHIRPMVRAEVDRAFAGFMPLLVATITESVDRRIMPQVRDLIEDAHRRAVVAGMTAQLNATGEQIGKVALRAVPREYMSTSRGD